MPSSGPDPINPCPFYAEDPRTECSSSGGDSSQWRIPSLDLQATLVLMQPRMQLAFWTASTHTSWSMSSFSSARIPMLFSTGLLPMNFSLSLYLCLGVPWPGLQHIALGLAELHGALIDPLLNFSQVSLGGILSFSCINCTAQLQVICRLSEDAASKTEL